MRLAKKTRLGGAVLRFWFWGIAGLCGFLLLVFGLAQTVFRFFRLRGRHFLTPDSALPVVWNVGRGGWVMAIIAGFSGGLVIGQLYVNS
jgi:hypothetical protein